MQAHIKQLDYSSNIYHAVLGINYLEQAEKLALFNIM